MAYVHSEWRKTIWGSLSAGASLGGVAALCVALGDFGASWLWLTLWHDRAMLLVRLLVTETPIGVFVGAACAMVFSGFQATVRWLSRKRPERASQRMRIWFPLPWTLIAGGPLIWVAKLLFTGGRMSRVPYKGVLVALVATSLVLGFWIFARFAHAMFERSKTATQRESALIGGGAFLLYIIASKIDQTVLPNLYGYLHACLAVFGFVALSFALLVFARRSPSFPWARLTTRGATGVVLLAVAGAVIAVDISTLESNQNVRVALLDPRAATSRSLMFGLEPLMRGSGSARATDQAIRRARADRDRRRRRAAAGELIAMPESHILLITVDALRADHLGLYGYKRPVSPKLDEWAKTAIVFEHAYAQAPHSSYSLSSLMTSEYLHETVEIGQPPPESTLARTLAENGYHTAAFYTTGIFHTEGERLDIYQRNAFDFALHDHTHRPAEQQTARALQEVDRIVAKGEPKSFLWVHYFDVHEPYLDTRFGTSEMDRYDSEIRHVDGAIDTLIRETKKRFRREVVTLLSADHGEEFRDHGGVYHGSSLFEEQVHVPLIVQAETLAPRRVAEPVELVDVAPTILGLTGIKAPSTMRGDDLRPLAVGQNVDLGPAFSAVLQKRMAVRWPYKLIADLKFGLYQIYNLESDPKERRNLANQEPKRVDALRGELYAWLDSLSQRSKERSLAAEPSRAVALDRGTLGDRRALSALTQILEDESEPAPARVRAAKALGALADGKATASLGKALHSAQPEVAAEAAIALGRMGDTRARGQLRRLVLTEDPIVRARAALALGRLRDSVAVPGLVEALWVAPSSGEREDAVRWLGWLRDPRAVEPLLSLLPDLRLRYLTVLSLGRIGDLRSFDTLMSMLDWEKHANVRENVVSALGMLGDPRALPRILEVAALEPDIKSSTETLVRLGALERGEIGGTDIHRGLPNAKGFHDCYQGTLVHDWDYRQRTYCYTSKNTASFRIRVPHSVAQSAGGTVVIAGVRRTDDHEPAPFTLQIGETTLASMPLEGNWTELRWKLDSAALTEGSIRVTASIAPEQGRFAIDHIVIVRRPPELASASR